MTKTVTKKDGTRVPYDVSKIKEFISRACDGLDVNQLELESKLDIFIKDGIKTTVISDNIVQHAIQLATAQEPDWTMVAGRAYAMNSWAKYKMRGKTFKQIVRSLISKGLYSSELKEHYSEADLDLLGTVIDFNRDLAHSHGSLVTATRKYQNAYELNQHMHMVNAMRFGQFEKADTRIEFVKNAYNTLSFRELSLATPFMNNLREGGNIASCFIVAPDDDLDSIFDSVKDVARISKNGGGVGIYLGYLRAKGSSVGRALNAAGPITQWAKIYNDTLVAVNQGGRRAGSGTLALPIWHADVEDFIDMQTEHGDQRLKSHDVFPQIVVPDLFMIRQKNQQPFTLFCPFEASKLGLDVRGKYGKDFEAIYEKIEEAFSAGKLKVGKVIKNSRDLLKLAMKQMFENGLPYVAFIDRINEVNPNKGDPEAYGIPCVNLCVESFSNVVPDKYAHVCNLASINMGSIVDFEHLAKVARTTVRLLDYGISMTRSPIPETAAHNARYRTIGIGIMGLHDYLAREFRTYKDLSHIAEISECIEYNAVLESVELAKQYGSFEAFEHSMWKSGERIAVFKKHSCGKYDWDYAQSQIDLYGMRNSQLTSPAPTTSTSIYQDATATFLPAYDAFFSEDDKSGINATAVRFLKQNPIGYARNQSQYDPKEIIDVVAAMQPFTDTGISMELILDQNKPGFSAKDLYDTINYAWEKGLKTIYYIRSIKKNETSIVKEEPACVGCAG